MFGVVHIWKPTSLYLVFDLGRYINFDMVVVLSSLLIVAIYMVLYNIDTTKYTQ